MQVGGNPPPSGDNRFDGKLNECCQDAQDLWDEVQKIQQGQTPDSDKVKQLITNLRNYADTYAQGFPVQEDIYKFCDLASSMVANAAKDIQPTSDDWKDLHEYYCDIEG